MIKHLEKLQEYLILGTLTIFPAFALPFFLDTTNLPKVILLVSVILLFLILLILRVITEKAIKFKTGRLDIFVIIIALSYTLSSLIKTPNKMEAFFVPGTATVVIVASLMYLLCNQIENKKNIAVASFAGAVIFTIIFIVSSLSLFPSLKINNDYLITLVFLAPQAILGLTLLITQTDWAKRALIATSLFIVGIGITISFLKIQTGQQQTSPQLPTLETSKIVALDSLKDSAILGIGPGNYLTAFNLFRPANYNQTPYWALRFTAGRDFYLTVLTEAGIFGLLSILLLIGAWAYFFGKDLPSDRLGRGLQLGYFASIGTLFLLLAIFPTAPLITFSLFVLLSLNSKTELKRLNIKSKLWIALSGAVICLLIVFVIFKTAPALQAEADFKLAYDALNKNDGQKTYDLLKQATILNPYIDRYHASFAQVNFALAQSLSQKKNLTDNDKQVISNLVLDAIKEGQFTVNINMNRSDNWSVLALIYKQIIPYNKDAVTYAKESYGQAINLDPLNPSLRIDLGGVYFAEGTFDDAIIAFQTAVAVKPDLPNSHYNLAISYREKGDIANAIQEINTVLTLVDPKSNDYKLAKNELDGLEKKKNSQSITTPESLTTPQANTPAINTPLTLPINASPSATQK